MHYPDTPAERSNAHPINADGGCRRAARFRLAGGGPAAANKIGRLDPATGEIKLVTPPTPNARPYGLAVNAKNAVYFVEFGTNKIATIDTKTMAIKEYVLPDPAARPRRLAISPDDAIWYSDYARGYLGRLDPATGQVREWQSPSGPKS